MTEEELKEWEARAKLIVYGYEDTFLWAPQKRILALIEEVRRLRSDKNWRPVPIIIPICDKERLESAEKCLKSLIEPDMIQLLPSHRRARAHFEKYEERE